MISKELEFYAPSQLADALALVGTHGDRAKILAGGMSLVPSMNLGLVRPEIMISLNHIPGLDYISDDGGALRIGAMARHHQIQADPLIRRFCPLLSEAASVVGDVQVRHRGTIGGSIVHADPAADYLPVMVAADAKFKLQSSKQGRVVAAKEFFLDIMRTSLAPSEVLVEIQIPKLSETSRSAYIRLARVEGNFAIVGAASIVRQESGSARVAIGGVCPTPVLIEVPVGSKGTESGDVLKRVGQTAYDACRDAYGDLSGDANYRRAMARVYAQRAVRAAVSGSVVD
jgi:carbon-monoxide dehydrogenase medium subunit